MPCAAQVLPGAQVVMAQPIHDRSGRDEEFRVRSDVAVKVFGDGLDLSSRGRRIARVAAVTVQGG